MIFYFLLAPLKINIPPQTAKITYEANDAFSPSGKGNNICRNIDEASDPRESISIPDIINPSFLFGLASLDGFFKCGS